MLCSKIIFTREYIECSELFTEFTNNQGIKCRIFDGEDISECELNSEDEELYLVCCELTRYVRDRMIKTYINKKLTKVYACFNSDEQAIIVSNVLSHNFMEEIPGRMYVYLKMNKKINPFAFYRFMCTDIQKLADSITCAEADRILSINDDADLVDLLKYFARISSDSADTIELTAHRGEVRITGCSSPAGCGMTEYASEDADILAELVTMNPKKIEINGKEEFLKTEIADVITAIFKERIYYK